MTRRGTGSFWWLVAATSVVLVVMLDAALFAVSRTLPCTWAGASWLGWDNLPGSPCFMFGSHYPAVQWGVPAVAAVILISALGAGAVTATRTIRRTRTATAALLTGAHPPANPTLIAAARAAGPFRLLESPDQAPWCFCLGWLRPTIVISTGFIDRLDLPQLRAVLAHERHHAHRRDPLRLLIARTLSALGYLIPSLRDLFTAALLESELAADRAATDAADRRALAGALRVALASPPPARLGVAFAADDTALTRAACLSGAGIRTRRWRRGALIASGITVAVALAASLIIGPELALQDVTVTGPASPAPAQRSSMSSAGDP